MNFSNLTNDPKIEVTPRFVISNNGNYTYPTYNSCLQFKPSDFLYFKLTLRNSTIQQFIGKAILRVYCYGINGNLTAKLYNCGGYTFATNENYELDSNNEEYIDVASVSECGNGETILSFDITSHIRKLDNGDSIVLGFKIVQLINANGYIEVDVPSNKEVCLVTEPVVSGLNGIYKYDNHQIGDVNLSINLFDGQPVFSSQIVKTLGERLPLEFSLFQYYKKYFDADGISHLRNGVVPNFYYQIDRSNDDYHHLMQPDGTIKVYKQLWDESLEQLELELGVKNIICGASLFYCYSDKTYYFIDDSTNDIMMYLYDKYNNKITYQLEDVGSNPVRYITRIMEVETLQKDKITYTWNGNRLSSVANSEGEVMEFEYVESGYISKVKIPQMNCHVLISETSNSINVVLYNELSNGQNTKIKEFTVYFSNGQITSIYDSILKQYLDLDYYNGRVSKATIFNQTKSEKLYSTEYTYTKEYTQVLDSLGNKVFHYFDSYGRVLTSIDDSGNVSSCSYLDGVTNCMIYETRYVANCGNLLYNSSFDNSINISTNQSCWNVTSNESIVSIVNETPFSNKCLKIEGVSTEKVIVKQTASVKKSGTYKLTGYIKHPNLEMLTSDNLKVIVYGTYSTLNPDNFSLETNTFEKNATLNFANNDWYQFEVNDLEIIEGAAGIKLEVCLEVDRVSTVVYFDNLFLVNSMIKSNYNIIENGNFDFQINNIPLGWTFSNMGVEDKLFSNSGNKFSNMLGNNVFVIAPGNRMADTSSATYALRRMSCTQIVKGYANENLTFNVLAKADITSYVTFKAYIKINFKDGSNERYEMNFVKNCINWQLLSTSIITKGDYSSVEVGIYYDGGVEATIGSIQLYKSNGGIHYKYDKFNNLVEIIDVDGDITKYKYNQNNQVVEVYSTKDNYRKNSYYKDRLSNSKNAYGDLNEYIYDGENHLTKERVLLYNGDISRSVTYDESNRKTFKDEYENSTTCACDSLKRPWIITSPCGQQTIYSYNSKLLLESVQATINSMINKNTLTYDEKGLLGIAEEYSGNKYVTQYDTFGRIVSISCNDNLLETYEYDSLLNGYRKGLLVGKRVASNGGYYEFEYDDNNRLSKVKLNGSVIATYKYYADGSLFEIYDVQNLETIRYKYDEKDRIKQINTNDDSIEYKYNFSCIKSVYNIDGDIRSCEYGHDVKENIYSYITKLALTYNNRVVTDTEYINAAKVIDKSYLQIFDYSLNIRLMKFFEYSSYYSFEADGDKSFIAWVKPSEKGTENSKVNVISFNSEGNTPVAYLRVNEDNTLTFHNSNISIQTGVKMKLDEWNLVGVNFKGTGTNKIIQIILNGTITEQSANDMNFDFKSFTLSNQNNLMASAQYLAKPLTYLVALSSSHVYSEEEVKDIYELGKLALMTNDE